MSIFLSHSDMDDAVVRGLVSDLEAFGKSVWLDKKDLVGGESWWPAILKQIRTCDVFVFAVSANSLESDPCNAEFDYARSLQRPILPVKIGDVPGEEILIHEIFSGQVVDYREPDKATAYALIRALSEREGATRVLPDPLPPEPPTPYEYLLLLGRVIRGRDDISRTNQESIVRQLGDALRREKNASVQTSIASLLNLLRARDDITVRTTNDIDSLLVEAGCTIEPERKPKVKAGWYVDPSNSGSMRYWDGSKWTDLTRKAPEVRSLNASAKFSTLGIIFGLVSLIPWVWGFGPVALTFAIIAVARRQRRGVAALVISIVCPIAGFIVWGIWFATTQRTT